ncbi:MAG TPA: tryptophan halogenase family protein [Steroidobacteraceae bacterium]
MVRSVLIVGGGTAGWITAGYLARMLGADSPAGVRICLVESADLGVIGVGEGTFPTIRRTLQRIGISEARLIRECGATFKQGIRFVNWRHDPSAQRSHYMHSFQSTQNASGLDLLSYWLLGVAGQDESWAEVNTPQKIVSDAVLAPKLITHSDFKGPLNYAYHVDAVKLAHLLRKVAIEAGVQHIVDTIDGVNLGEDGAIRSVVSRNRGELSADLYVDCTGFRAQLIGQALEVPDKPCGSVLFCDTALAIQVPYDQPADPVAAYTISTAHEAGWTWDIGLDTRRGIGYVYSSSHTDDTRAEEVLRAYAGKAARNVSARKIQFNSGYKETHWYKNCVAIGLSSGFFEPLEATGIILVEAAVATLAKLFPWGGDFDVSARQFNRQMCRRYERALAFIKAHYCISERRDTPFWRDNIDANSIPDELDDLLARWRHRPPGEIDFDLNTDIFTEHSWQYVLYGMGYKTDLAPRAGLFKFHEEARQAFAEIRRQAQFACRTLPAHRELLQAALTREFGEARS